ncbi:hypothetical protein BGZ68_005419 [Mortierella alpina]|nr:hypothetical protein BGZ68_005419 [Mortierella alpina]
MSPSGPAQPGLTAVERIPREHYALLCHAEAEKAKSANSTTPSEPQPANKGNATETETETDAEEEDNGIIDHATFDQLLEMDDEEDHEFSKSLVENYFDQAETTFEEMNSALEELDFPTLSRLGHFLKGSSAALGLTKVKESCEKLQHYGNCKDALGVEEITETEAKDLITALLEQMREEYDEAKNYLEVFYKDQAES